MHRFFRQPTLPFYRMDNDAADDQERDEPQEIERDAIGLARSSGPGSIRGADMYECFHCGARSVIWDADFDFEDYGIPGSGVVHACHCTCCGARIEYYVGEEEI